MQENFLKANTSSVVIWPYSREMKANSWNFKNAAIFPC